MAKKLSELVELYVEQEFRDPEVFTISSSADEVKAKLREEGWRYVLDELSEELLKLAGNGLPIQGQRRIADRLGIPRDKVE